MSLYNKTQKKVSRKIKKIKNLKSEAKTEKLSFDNAKMISGFSKLTSKFEDRERIAIKLIRAGNPFSSLGINENNYTTFKIIFAFISAALMLKGNSVSIAILYGAAAYAIIEWFVYRKTKKRHQLIDDELDLLVSSTVDLFEQGYNEVEIFTLLAERIDNDNPLYTELIRAKIKIGSNTVYTDMASILNEFQDRIGMENIDNYCLALKQHGEAGKAKRMLKKQLELIRSEGGQKKKRETQYRANLNSVAIALLVVCIMLIILVPLVIMALDSAIFKI